MSLLERFSKSEREILVSLPYRVGVLMGDAEDEAGVLDDIQEGLAHERTLRHVLEVCQGQALMTAILEETLCSRAQWPAWAEHSFSVIADATAARHFLKAQVGDAAIRQYRTVLLNVAYAIAEASGEFGESAKDSQGFFPRLIEKMKNNPACYGAESMHVAAAEQALILELSCALADEGEAPS